MGMKHLFTSESVTEGHPDKVADQISDGILDAILEQDPGAHVACECLVTTGLAFISAEISTSAYVEIPRIVRSTIRSIGYTDATYGFDHQTCAVITSIDDQSGDIKQGVDPGGAGDQGLMFGYATRETPELMPLPILLAHRLCQGLARLRQNGTLPYLRPDGKSQVTVEYEDGKPVCIDTVVLAAQHHPDVSVEKIREDLKEQLVRPLLKEAGFPAEPRAYHINRTGRFVNGGPKADTGLTGRKIIVDTYGGLGSHGGGAFSGKDPTKVDRSASYAARWIAKNIVGAGLADECEIQIAYVIGEAHPVSIHIDTFGTGKVADLALRDLVRRNFDLRPQAIIERLELTRPIYRKTACYGHFGRNEPEFTWEKLDRVADLQRG
jgi:S-adenosylmethionine synthetase